MMLQDRDGMMKMMMVFIHDTILTLLLIFGLSCAGILSNLRSTANFHESVFNILFKQGNKLSFSVTNLYVMYSGYKLPNTLHFPTK